MPSHFATVLAVRRVLLFLILLSVVVALIALRLVGRGRDPQTGLAVLAHRLVLVRKVDGLALAAVLAALRQLARALGELGVDGCV